MKKLLFIFVFTTSLGYGLVYYPGDLLNSVKRTQVITDLFSQRFTRMSLSFYPKNEVERDYLLSRGYTSKHVDIFFRGENIQHFPVNTPYGLQNLTLFRLFGSTIVKFDEITDLGLCKWGLGIGVAGFRYGMYKSVGLEGSSSVADGGVDNVTFTVKDYLYSQFFDDLVVITNLFKPFGYLHLGLVMNKEVEPGLDGMLNTDDDVLISSKSRIFIDSNVLGFLFTSMGYNADRDKPEIINTKIELMSLIAIFYNFDRYKLPDVFVGYSYVNPSTKNIELNNMTTGFVEVYYNLSYNLVIDTMVEAFLKGSNGCSFIRQFFIESKLFLTDFLYNADSINDLSGFSGVFLICGVSSFSNDKLRNFGSDSSSVTGYLFGLSFSLMSSHFGGYLELSGSKNYSKKLCYLVDSYDHTYFELKFQIGF